MNEAEAGLPDIEEKGRAESIWKDCGIRDCL